MKKTKPFWIVVCMTETSKLWRNEYGNQKYTKKSSAVAVAEMLLRKWPYNRYGIMRLTDVCESPITPVVWERVK